MDYLTSFFSPSKKSAPQPQEGIPLIEIDKASDQHSKSPSIAPSEVSSQFQGSMYGSAFEQPIDEDVVLKARRPSFKSRLAEKELYEKMNFQANLKARRELERQEWEEKEEYLRKFPPG